MQLVNGLRVNREGSDDYNKFSKVFPDFLWLLRDVTLTPTDEKGNETDAKTFLLVNENTVVVVAEFTVVVVVVDFIVASVIILVVTGVVTVAVVALRLMFLS